MGARRGRAKVPDLRPALPFPPVAAIVRRGARSAPEGAFVGDKSPKSKQREQQQKKAAKTQGAAAAKSKQDGQSRAPLSKGKR